jgi:hypothetical protein
MDDAHSTCTSSVALFSSSLTAFSRTSDATGFMMSFIFVIQKSFSLRSDWLVARTDRFFRSNITNSVADLATGQVGHDNIRNHQRNFFPIGPV